MLAHKNNEKVIIFDMDETLGYFYEFSIMLDAIERFTIKN